MATGPEHYLSAERLLAGPQKSPTDRDRGSGVTRNWAPSQTDLLKAQVHATLALAAATALATSSAHHLGQDWLPVVGDPGNVGHILPVEDDGRRTVAVLGPKWSGS